MAIPSINVGDLAMAGTAATMAYLVWHDQKAQTAYVPLAGLGLWAVGQGLESDPLKRVACGIVGVSAVILPGIAVCSGIQGVGGWVGVPRFLSTAAGVAAGVATSALATVATTLFCFIKTLASSQHTA